MDPRRLEEELGKAAGAEIRAELHQWIEGALERMKQKQGKPGGGYFPSMAEREELAVSLGKELAEYLLEKNVASDRAFLDSLCGLEKAPCPRCRTLSPRAKDKQGKLRTKEILHKTRVGNVPIRVPLFGCWKCRRLFSPLERIPTRAESVLQR